MSGLNTKHNRKNTVMLIYFNPQVGIYIALKKAYI